jgi:thiosulfate/3-mercaptopyruvate sulfurtransferase
VTGDWVLEQLGEPPYDAPAIQLVDARSPGEFEAGRIPTALNVQWTLNLESGVLLPREQLASFYAELGLDPTRTTVTYCLAGWRGSVAWLVLTWLGFEDVRVYDGSWLEWGSDDRFPIEVDSGTD